MYRKEIQILASTPGARVWLDLGRACEIAEVALNGRRVPEVLWKPPYAVDATDFIQPGPNRLEITVTNLWPNQMIGDLQPGVTQRHAFTDYRPFRADSPLLESGLLGPVRLLARRPVEPARGAAIRERIPPPHLTARAGAAEAPAGRVSGVVMR